MKFKFIYTFFSISLLAFLFMSHSGGRADDQGKGNTAAPGDEMIGGNPRVCASCHTGANTDIMMTQLIEVLDGTGAAITEYVPGQTYRVKVTNEVVAGDPAGFGFQVLALKASLDIDGDDVAAFSNPANNVKIAIATSNGRQYAEHDGVSETNTFEVDWTAPATGTGAVSFYSCGNAVNDNNMNSGDASACTKIELAEGESSSTFEADGGVKIFLFPNPVHEEMKVQLISDISAEFSMDIFDMQGRLMVSETISFMNGENNFSYNVKDLSKGTYLVKFSNNEKIATAKLLKL